MAKLGYARVSTNQQSLDIQTKALVQAGVKESQDFLFTDKASGKNDDRDGLKLLRLKAREGDHVIVKKLDRLGRNTSDMIKIIEEFHQRGITIQFLDDGISTHGSMGKMVVTILAAVAQAERERILERTNEGRQAAISRGIKMGRKPSIGSEVKSAILRDIKSGIPKTKIALKYSISRQSIYKIVSESNLQF